ncbi:MAG TPA: PilZ domain-containing protein [Pyrinomonadaceae bacterium]|nr:PilZ domain-containing protein [Pyrinomonadaceae bacterium]
MEKRRYERVRVNIKTYWGEDAYCFWQDRVTSLSVGGCFIQTGRELTAGQQLYLRLWLRDGERILRGEVRYCLERVGLGVEFQELMERDKERLAELVEHYRDEQPAAPGARTS